MMEDYFAKHFSGPAFELLGTSHLVMLSAFIFLALSLILLRKLENERINKIFRYTLASVLIIQEISYHIWNAAIGEWTIQKMLPFHLCSIFVWICPVMLVTRNRRIYEFAFFLGISGAVQALATPDIGDYGFPHYRYFQMFISHGSILLSALYMTIVERFRPNWRSMGRVILWLNVYGVIIFFLNLIIGSNYLYVNHKPATASLFDIMGPWPIYLFGAEGIAIVMFVMIYLPFFIADQRRAGI